MYVENSPSGLSGSSVCRVRPARRVRRARRVGRVCSVKPISMHIAEPKT